jgi:ATP-dependent DNA helicase RecQ
MAENPLLDLPPAALEVMLGESRQRLVRYLSRWGHSEVLLRYLELWLADQPQSVTLRENRVRALLDLGRGTEALAVLDSIDAERAPSRSRAQARLRVLIAAGNFAEALARIDAEDSAGNAFYSQLLRGDVYRAQQDFEAAEHAYRAAATLDEESPAPARRMAALELQRGDAVAARAQIDALMLRPSFTPSTDDLILLRDAANLLDDQPAAAAYAAQLADHEREERARLIGEFNLKLEASDGIPTDLAAPAETVVERPLSGDAYRVLREEFGLNDFRPNQSRVIAAVMAGRRTLAIMPTGAGKSLTYQLPAMLLPQATVVVSPLIALMKDQIDGLALPVRDRATMINSSLSGTELRERLDGLSAGRYRLVYIAPERLRQRAFLQALKRCGVSLFVVDEAHCVSLWGLSFRPDYLFIGRALAELGQPPLLALTATASSTTQSEIGAYLGTEDRIVASVFRPNLYFQVVRAGNREEKEQVLVDLCRQISGSIIIYARARQACEDLAALLRRHGIAAGYYHAQVDDRSAAQERFMCGQTRVLVATVAFGMGIDKADVRAIIHYNLPQSMEAYYQEAGRAGRDGKPARCILLYAGSDKARMSQWLRESAITRDQLRELYRHLRRAIGGRFGIVNLDQLQRRFRDSDETFMRVGLSMLEQVGLVCRHFDAPGRITVSLRSSLDGDADFVAFVQVAGPAGNGSREYELIDLAAELGWDPGELENRLLNWQNAGLLRYRGSGNEALIEMLPAPPDVGERIDQLLADYQQRQDERIAAIAAYARGAQCRHRAIAAHFGQRLERCKNACDICAPAQRVAVNVVRSQRAAPGSLPERNNQDPRSDAQRALDGLKNLPFPMGRSGLAKVLKGAAGSSVDQDRCPEYAALRHLSLDAVSDLIEHLIDEGFILRDEQDEYRRLSLSSLGRKARRDPSRLPE